MSCCLSWGVIIIVILYMKSPKVMAGKARGVINLRFNQDQGNDSSNKGFY